jgi:hypothetical protein
VGRNHQTGLSTLTRQSGANLGGLPGVEVERVADHAADMQELVMAGVGPIVRRAPHVDEQDFVAGVQAAGSRGGGERRAGRPAVKCGGKLPETIMALVQAIGSPVFLCTFP